MIELLELQKTYSEKTVLSIQQLTISSGELVGLVGNNGAGKTTMLSLILDLIKPTKGMARSKQKDVSKADSWKAYTGSYLGEGFLIPFLTPLEFLDYVGSLHSKNKADLSDFLADVSGFFSGDMNANKYIRDLSLGNKNKIGILAAIYASPEILILDEPFANLDPGSQSWLKRKLTELNQRGVSVLMSSHDLKHVTDVCSRVLLLDNGKIIKDIHVSNTALMELEAYFSIQ